MTDWTRECIEFALECVLTCTDERNLELGDMDLITRRVGG